MSTFLISLLILSGTVLAGTPLPEEPLATFRSGSGIGKTKIDAIEEAISEAISKIIDEYQKKGWLGDRAKAIEKIRNDKNSITDISQILITENEMHISASVKVHFDLEKIAKELENLKQIQKEELKNEKIVTVECTEKGDTKEETRINLYINAIKMAGQKYNELNKIKNIKISAKIKRVIEINIIKNKDGFDGKAKIEVEIRTDQNTVDILTQIVSTGEGKNEGESIKSAIRKGIENEIDFYQKFEKEKMNENLREETIKKITNSIENKIILKQTKKDGLVKTTIFLEANTNTLLKDNAKQTNEFFNVDNKNLKINGKAIATKIESATHKTNQTMECIDIAIEEYLSCFEIIPAQDISKFSFDNNGNFRLQYKLSVDTKKADSFYIKWNYIFDKLKYRKTSFAKYTYDRSVDMVDFNKQEGFLFLYMNDSSNKNNIFEYAFTASFDDLKNKELSIYPVFEFVDGKNFVLKSIDPATSDEETTFPFASITKSKKRYLPFAAKLEKDIKIEQNIDKLLIKEVTGINSRLETTNK